MPEKFFNKSTNFLIPLLLVLLGVLLYSNTAFNSFQFDDNDFIVMNSSIRNLSKCGDIWKSASTRFIAFLTFACNYHLHKFDVFGYHLVNLAVHLAAAVSVWWLIILIFSTPIIKLDKISAYSSSIALFVSLIFLVHPLQTESVTYIYQRLTSLAGLFYILSICLYVKARVLQLNGEAGSGWFIYYLLSLLSCILGMFTKENTFTIPAAVVLCEIYFFGKNNRVAVRFIIPFFFSLITIPVTLFISRTYTFVNIRDLYQQPISGLHYLLTQLRVIITYIRLLFLPVNQNLDYDFHISKSLLELPTFASFLSLIIIIYVAIRLFSKYRLISFGVLFFFLTLSVESGVIPLYDVIFEHRLYLPIVGFGIFLVSGVFYLWSGKSTTVPFALLFPMVIFYTALTYSRNEVWKDEVVLWNDVIRKSPHKARPYNERGAGFLNKKEYDNAIADFTRAITLNPGYEKLYNNRGFAYLSKNEYSEAIADFNRALLVKPNYAGAYNNRGFAYLLKNEYDNAIADFTRAITLNPSYVEAYNNRAIVFLNKKEYDNAIADFMQVLRIEPNFPAVHHNLGKAYVLMGKKQEAIASYKKAIKVDPGSAQIHNDLGNLYYVIGENENAMKYFNKAIELNSGFAEAYKNLAVIYYAKKQCDLAVSYCDKAVKLGYEIEPALVNLLKSCKK